ncbi:hypothetical protein [Nocardioides pelophilus]|uniref:hypothetical protein n=1 Tax=Nocardioides pelophilus TaxID=2172019 RepID=UPI0015FF24AE|nr:hypothetical protein [Nocardioides pelophilus]
MRRPPHLIAALLLLPVLAACGSSADDQDSEPEFSAQETEWAELHCEVVEDLDEYDNVEGWDRCVEDNLPNAQEVGPAAQVQADAETDPRCATFSTVAECIDVLSFTLGEPVTEENEHAPLCATIWRVPGELPDDYSGCVREDRYIPADPILCNDNNNTNPILFIYSDKTRSYYAFTEHGSTSTISNAAKIGLASGTPAAVVAREVCAE